MVINSGDGRVTEQGQACVMLPMAHIVRTRVSHQYLNFIPNRSNVEEIHKAGQWKFSPRGRLPTQTSTERIRLKAMDMALWTHGARRETESEYTPTSLVCQISSPSSVAQSNEQRGRQRRYSVAPHTPKAFLWTPCNFRSKRADPTSPKVTQEG